MDQNISVIGGLLWYFSCKVMLFLLFKHIKSVKMLDSQVLDNAKVSYHEVGIC